MNPNSAKIFRIVGIAIICVSVGLLFWKIVQLHHLRARPDYFDPTEGERGVLANYLTVMVGIGIGCVFLWMGSRPGSGK